MRLDLVAYAAFCSLQISNNVHTKEANYNMMELTGGGAQIGHENDERNKTKRTAPKGNFYRALTRSS